MKGWALDPPASKGWENAVNDLDIGRNVKGNFGIPSFSAAFREALGAVETS